MFARASESWTGFCTNGDVVLAPGTAMQVNADAPAVPSGTASTQPVSR